MKTVLNVKTDKDIKEKAQALAKHLGIPLSTVVNAYLKEFVTSGDFKISREPDLNTAVQKELAIAVTEAKAGKNMSPAFTNAAAAISWLNS